MFNGIIDLSHNNPSVDLAKAKESGIAAVILKATEGHTLADPMYMLRRSACQKLGLLCSAYHFANGLSAGLEQANWFLEKALPDSTILCVLDIERNFAHGRPAPNMSLAEAANWIERVTEQTGRVPMIYGGEYLRTSMHLLHGAPQVMASVLACELWLADYRTFPQGIDGWANWTLWQFTDSAQIAGIGKCDRSQFNGTQEELTAWWPGSGE
jgi:lysozyme